jgi:hypothetical protein
LGGETSWISQNRKAVDNPKSSHPFNASSVPSKRHLSARNRL